MLQPMLGAMAVPVSLTMLPRIAAHAQDKEGRRGTPPDYRRVLARRAVRRAFPRPDNVGTRYSYVPASAGHAGSPPHWLFPSPSVKVFLAIGYLGQFGCMMGNDIPFTRVAQ